MLDREAILGAQDMRQEEVQVPEWGGSVLIRTMTGKERDTWEESHIDRTGLQPVLDLTNARASLVALVCVNAEGKRLFTQKDVEALGEKNGKALDRIYSAAQVLNGLTQPSVEAARGNSGGDRSADSGSG
jgi:hypothetical protein